MTYWRRTSLPTRRQFLALAVDWIEIKWPLPSGRVERIANPPIDRYITIVEGKGRIR